MPTYAHSNAAAVLEMDVEGVAWDPNGPSQQISWDAEGDVPGFGVRVYPSGTKSFVVWVRNRETGRKRLLTVGRVGEMTLAEARDRAARQVESYRGARPGARSQGDRPSPSAGSSGPGPSLTPTQVLELLAAIDQEANAFRRAAMRVYVQTDLPQKDLLRIEWADVDLSSGELRVAGAGGEKRRVPVSMDVTSILGALPRHDGTAYVFCGRPRGSHLADLRRSWRAARERAGIPGVSLDDLRRVLASDVPPKRILRAETVPEPSPYRPGPPTESSAATTSSTPAPGRASGRFHRAGSARDAGSAASAIGGGSGERRRARSRLPATTLGVEIGQGRLRVYRPDRRRRPAEAMEVEWASPPPRASVEALVGRFGKENVVSVALDMAFVHVKRLDLPPLPMDERRSMISLDARRYFPILDEELVAGVRDDDLVIATSAPKLDSWIEALGALGTVERVESAPSALTRHLARDGLGDGVLILAEPSERDVTVARIEGGSLAVLRKVPAAAAEVADIVAEMVEPPVQVVLHPFRDDIAHALGSAHTSVTPMPPPTGSPAAFGTARGAALGVADGPGLTLTSPVLERRLGVARRRRAVVHVAALVASLVLLAGAIDHRRNATLGWLEEEITTTEDRAAVVLELSEEASSIAGELSLLADEMRARSNPMDVVLEVTRLLPTTAYLTQLTSTGDQWELSGLAEDAATLIPLLEASPRLADVRFRAATTRARAQGRDLESFSVVFRHVPAT